MGLLLDIKPKSSKNQIGFRLKTSIVSPTGTGVRNLVKITKLRTFVPDRCFHKKVELSELEPNLLQREL